MAAAAAAATMLSLTILRMMVLRDWVEPTSPRVRPRT
jgi:hypothetical protein